MPGTPLSLALGVAATHQLRAIANTIRKRRESYKERDTWEPREAGACMCEGSLSLAAGVLLALH